MADTTDRYAQALIAQGVDYATAEDKAFMSGNLEAEARAAGGKDATARALALYLNIDPGTAMEAILTAQED